MTTLSYAHGTSTEPLLGDTIGAHLRRTADRLGDREALVDVLSGTRWTYRELDDRVDVLARALLGLHVAKGDRVGIWAPNRPEWLLLQYATARIGAILVNINPAYRTHELRYVLRQAGVSVLVAAEAFRSADYRAMVREVRPDCPRLSTEIFLGTDWHDLLGLADGVTLSDQDLSPDDPINIQYTSGTTGFPKGATLSHHSILNNAYFVAHRQGWSAADRVCVPVPFYHCFGNVLGTLAAMTHGACVVVPAPAFDARATLAAVEQERCTALYGVPTMFIAELAEPGFGRFDLSSLRTGVMAGSPCPVEVMKRVVADMGMAEVTICYGMTETSPVATQSRRDDDLDLRVSTVGTALPHIEVKIVDPVTGLTVPRGEPGEFCTRGYSVMLGYWDMPERTAEVIDAARWMHTGDLAVMTADGYVNIVGRIKDVVIRGGENVYPTEVEEFLRAHPGLLDVQVIGVPDDRYGEEVMAWVIPRDGAEPPTAAALRDFCAGRLATHKIPRYVLVVDAFPLTVTGKVRKTEMRDRSIRELGLEAAAAAPTA
ncbi:AMP-binding protein [Actinoplanes sp. NPDC051411]|uniref:AMP-binding protein n=1 Tax=Actinoplanes sp. NPDC051411 TaxID=3155522 RepID=UPI0034495FC0